MENNDDQQERQASGVAQKQMLFPEKQHKAIDVSQVAELKKDLIDAVKKDSDRDMRRILAHAEAKEILQRQILDEDGSGVLQIAASRASVPVVKQLIQAKFDVNGVDARDGTALQAAILSDKSDVAIQAVTEILLKASGSDINTHGGPYGSALQAACYRYNTRKTTVAKLLDMGAEINNKGGKYGNAFEAACVHGDEDLMLRLASKLKDVNMVSKIHGTPLQAAACIGRESVVKSLIGKNADVGLVGGFYGTALQAAAKGIKELPEEKKLHEHNTLKPTPAIFANVTRLLLDNGANPTTRGGYHGSPLNAAVFSELPEILELLLNKADELAEAGLISVQQIAESYGNALMSAILQLANPLPQIELLIQHGANVNYNAVASNYLHPLDAASFRGLKDVVTYLLNRRAHINARGGQHGSALRAAVAAGQQEVARMLINLGADYTSGDVEYGNLLQIATYEGEEDVVGCLLKSKADLTIKDLAQRTILHIAAWRGSPQIMRDIVASFHHDALEYYLHAKNAWGVTPLQEAREATERSPPATVSRTRWAPEEVVQILEEYEMRAQHDQRYDGFGERIKGPSMTGKRQEGMAKPVSTAPSLNPGLGFGAVVVDFFSGEFEVHQVRKTDVDSLLYNPGPDNIMDQVDSSGSYEIDSGAQRTPSAPDAPAPGPPNPGDPPGNQPQRTLRWIHLHGSNMVWVEELVNRMRQNKGEPTVGRELWGSGSQTLSSKVPPHARSISPQFTCLSNITSIEPFLSPEFLAMPYIHWESGLDQEMLSRTINIVPKTDFNKDPINMLLGARKQDFEYMLRLWSRLEGLVWEKRLWRSILDFVKNSNLFEYLVGFLADSKLMNYFRKDRTRRWKWVVNEDIYHYLRNYERGLWPQPEYGPTVGNHDSFAQHQALLETYLYKDPPLHIRRTLDQYFYSWLDNTSRRDRDQVLSRYYSEGMKSKALNFASGYQIAKRRIKDIRRGTNSRNNIGTPKKAPPPAQLRVLKLLEDCVAGFEECRYQHPHSPVLIIDQLWIWVIEGTVISSFPQRQETICSGIDPENGTDVLNSILQHLRNPNRLAITKPHDLVQVIVSHCLKILSGGLGSVAFLDYMRVFSISTDKAVDQAMALLTEFVTSFERFRKEPEDSPADFEAIFSVIQETHLFREVQDIRDELGILEALFLDQKKVLDQVISVYGNDLLGIIDTSFVDSLLHVSSQLRAVSRMQIQTEQAYKTLKDLLNLKQQQANVLEARITRRQATSTGEQGKTIMVFTIVTIIFLPLTFITTVFQLNIVEFPRVTLNTPAGDITGLRQKYVFDNVIGVTAAIAVPLIVIAFNVTRIDGAWGRFMNLGPVRRRFKPSLADYNAGYDLAEMELKMLRDLAA